MSDDPDLAALLCSRLCHDLISPVGAVGNGMELLLAEPDGDREEYGLIADSARAAIAGLAFFRLAFGAAAASSPPMGAAEVGRIVTAYFANTRHAVGWPASGAPLPRPHAKLILLMLLAAATATPLGGRLEVPAIPDGLRPLRIDAVGRRAELRPDAEAMMTGADMRLPDAPRDAHLALLGRHAAAVGRSIAIERGEDRITFSA